MSPSRHDRIASLRVGMEGADGYVTGSAVTGLADWRSRAKAKRGGARWPNARSMRRLSKMAQQGAWPPASEAPS